MGTSTTGGSGVCNGSAHAFIFRRSRLQQVLFCTRLPPRSPALSAPLPGDRSSAAAGRPLRSRPARPVWLGPPRSAVHSHATRRAAELSLPQIQNESGRRRLCYRGVALLNELDVREAVPFKATLRNTLLERQRTEANQ